MSIDRQLNPNFSSKGCGVVSQEFSKLGWDVVSVDCSDESNATHRMTTESFLQQLENRKFMRFDAIWASPPCTTCSKLTAHIHRDVKSGDYEKTDLAHEHNDLLRQMRQIITIVKVRKINLQWHHFSQFSIAKERNRAAGKFPPIVVIENPDGQLKGLPFMVRFCANMSMQIATVCYCNFDRLERKQTNLWTNHTALHRLFTLRKYSTCTCASKHLHNVRDYKEYNFAAIPEALAGLVAQACNVHCRSIYTPSHAPEIPPMPIQVPNAEGMARDTRKDHRIVKPTGDLEDLVKQFERNHNYDFNLYGADNVKAAFYALCDESLYATINVVTEVHNMLQESLQQLSELSWVYTGMKVRKITSDGEVTGVIDRPFRMVLCQQRNRNILIPKWRVSYGNTVTEVCMFVCVDY